MSNSEMLDTLRTADRINADALRSEGAARIHGLDAAESLFKLAATQAPDLDGVNLCEMKADLAGRLAAQASVAFFANAKPAAA